MTLRLVKHAKTTMKCDHAINKELSLVWLLSVYERDLLKSDCIVASRGCCTCTTVEKPFTKATIAGLGLSMQGS